MTQADPNVELRPCAHCGGEPYRHEADLEIIAAVAIGCSSCGALGPFVDEANFKTDAEMWSAAEVAWNTRVEPTLHPLQSETVTPEMIEAGMQALWDICREGYDPHSNTGLTAIYFAMQRSTPTAPVQGDDAEITDVNRAGRELDRRDTQVELLRLRTFVLKLAGFSFPQAGEGSDGKRFAKALREIRRDARNLLDTLGDAK